MTSATRQIVTTAIQADPSMTKEEKERLVRLMSQPTERSVEMRYFTEKQAATILGVSISTVARMKREGTLVCKKVHRRRRITAESVYSAGT